ncbi:MAG: HD domain-containing protein [Gammaproteobacteria bacterium]|nr:HD domain-containing protein [Gammaproteobacteria bacterium]
MQSWDRRRFVLAAAGGSAVCISARLLALAAGASAHLTSPRAVAGIALPDTALARAAADMAQAASPDFLFRHCMRTYVFAALLAAHDHIDYDAEMIFIAAALHDLGLTTAYATADHCFEMDGADAAKAFLVSRGVADARAELVWDAIAMHTSMLLERRPPQVGLIGGGAGADVFGSGIAFLPKEKLHAVLAAFPRGEFNIQFRDLLVDHCRRKPFSQRGTWLDNFCRAHNPGLVYPDLESRLLNAQLPASTP